MLTPGGRVITSTWGNAEDSLWHWYGDLCAAYGIGVKLRTQALDTPRELRDTFEPAGFIDVQVDTILYEQVYDDEEDWWTTSWSISGRAALEQLEPSALDHFKAEAFEHMQAAKQPDGFHQQLQAHFALATKPPRKTSASTS